MSKLSNYDLANTDGLKGVDFEGTFYALDKIDDTVAARLFGKTHILVEKGAAPAAAPGTSTGKGK